MPLSATAASLHAQLDPSTKMGELRRLAKETRRNHPVAMELWATGDVPARLLAILLMDKRKLTQAVVDGLTADAAIHPLGERNRLVDWLMANQLSKSAAGIALLESWADSPSPLQRRLFWYHQARCRWTGQPPPPNTEALLDALDERLADEEEEVQWAMNFTAGQIGTYEPEHRARCIALGERTGLYRDQVVHRGCTPDYLPEFIRMQAEKVGT